MEEKKEEILEKLKILKEDYEENGFSYNHKVGFIRELIDQGFEIE